MQKSVFTAMHFCAQISLLIRLQILVAVMATGILFIGCAPLKDRSSADTSSNSSFSIARSSMNPGAVAVQLAVVQLDSDQREMFEQFWGHLDQLKLPLTARKTADENGLRYAVMSPQIPSILTELLKSRDIDLNALDDLKRQMAEAGILKSPSRMVLHQRIENDTGEEYAIPTSDVYPQKEWSIAGTAGNDITGNGQWVKGVYQLASFPQSDGSVRLVMLPEIHHGLPRNRFDVSQRTFLMSESQIETKVTPLEFKVDLELGETLIIAPNGSAEGIGDLFFGQQGLAATQSSIDQTSDLYRQIEAAVVELDESISDEIEPDSLGKGPSASVGQAPVKPLFRFLMIRLLHTQSENAWDADMGERLTTVNHD